MAQITLDWDNSNILDNPNIISQRASYRPRTAGGPFITVGFIPSNDMDKTVITADTPNTLSDNIVYEVKVEAICTVNGPTINDNGVQEFISFACLTPVLTKTSTTANITLNVSGLDITKARFTLRRASDNLIMTGPTVVARVGTTISLDKTGLVGSTGYYWQVELYATINSTEVISSSSTYLGTICSPYPFTTDAPPVCDPITAVTVTSIEIP